MTSLHILTGSGSDAVQVARAVLARHPNADPESSPLYIADATAWIPPAGPGCDGQVIEQDNLPDNYAGMFQNYYLGVGGTCDMYELDNSRWVEMGID